MFNKKFMASLKPRKVSQVKFKKLIFPDFLKAIKKGDTKKLLQAKKQHYKINIYWLIENHKKVSKKTMDYLLKRGMVKKSTKNVGKLLDQLKS